MTLLMSPFSGLYDSDCNKSLKWACKNVIMLSHLFFDQKSPAVTGCLSTSSFQSLSLSVSSESTSPLICLPAICLLHLWSNFISSPVLYINLYTHTHTLRSLGGRCHTTPANSHSLFSPDVSVVFFLLVFWALGLRFVFFRRETVTEMEHLLLRK